MEPGREDVYLTRKLQEGSRLLADHLIVSKNAFYSFADEGLL
ncbi:hypothetical protein EZ444_08455 [Pedobacter hiemivivus]|uniref:MPN domain-containing protein n=1 Tax=Pedobacter hiemivivus TaxID=2530454 RepID=A0A4R0NAN4_9SPHI|nr:hypothetical protein EZ444_08455 [Pedobacter hiemivivus]